MKRILLLTIAAMFLAAGTAGSASALNECRVYVPTTPVYIQGADAVKSTATTYCTSAVYQRVHVILERRNALGTWQVMATSPATGYIVTATRAATVSDPCANVLSPKYAWRAYAWMQILVNGVAQSSPTTNKSPYGYLYCK